jgi:predicted nucleic acid-binding protein
LKRAVLDASVVLKWYLPDEDHGRAALELLKRYLADDLEIIAPSLLEYEIINGLFVAQKRSRLQEEVIIAALEGFMNLGIRMVGVSGFYPRVISFCRDFNRSAYDASYLALAEVEQIPFITADQNLFNAVKKDLKWVKWLTSL